MVWFWGKIWLRTTSRRSPLEGERLGYFRGSFNVLIDALACAARDAGADLITGDGPNGIETARRGGWDVVLDSEVISVDAVVVTTPSPVLARLVPDLPESYRQKLGGLEYEAAVVALLQLSHPLSDIYWLNVADDDLPFTGVIEHTNFVSPDEYGGKRFVYLSKYLEPDHPYFTMPDERADRRVRAIPETDQSRIRAAPGSNEPGSFASDRPNRSFPCNYSERIPDHRTGLPGLYLANTTQIYPEDRGTNYSVRLGNQIAAIVADDLSRESRPRLTAVQTMRPARTPRLELEEIVSTYEEGGQRLTALDGLSLKVDEAEFVALVGPSGSGKSTLLDIVAGLITQDSGTVRLDGEPTTAAQRLGQSAYMQQRDLLLPWRTTTGNAALGLEASGMSRVRRRAKGSNGALAFWSRWLRRCLPGAAFGRHAPARGVPAHDPTAQGPRPVRRTLRRARCLDALGSASLAGRDCGSKSGRRCCSSPTTSKRPSFSPIA